MGGKLHLMLSLARSVSGRVGSWLALAALAAPGGVLAVEREYAYVAHGDNSYADISVLDTASQTLLTTIPLGFTRPYVTAHPNGKFVFVSGETRLGSPVDIAVIDTSTDQVVRTIPGTVGWGGNTIVSGNQVVIFQPPDFRFAWARGLPDGDFPVIAVIDTEDPSFPVRRMTLDSNRLLLGLTFTQNGQAAIVSEENGTDNFVRWIDTTSLQTQDLLRVGGGWIGPLVFRRGEIFVATQFPPVINVIPAALPLSIARAIEFSRFAAGPVGLIFDPSGDLANVIGYTIREPPAPEEFDFIWQVSVDTPQVLGTIESGSNGCLFNAGGTRFYCLFEGDEGPPLEQSFAGFMQINTDSHTVMSRIGKWFPGPTVISSAFALTANQRALVGGGGINPNLGFLWFVNVAGPEMQFETQLAFDAAVNGIAILTREQRPEEALLIAVGSVAYVQSAFSISVVNGQTFDVDDVINSPFGFDAAVTFALNKTVDPVFYRAYAISGGFVRSIDMTAAPPRPLLESFNIGGGIPVAMAATPDGSRIYVATLRGNIRVIHTDDPLTVETIDVGGRPTRGIAVTDAGGSLRGYATSPDGVLALDLNGTPTWTLISIPPEYNFGSPNQVAISRDGKFTYVTGGQTDGRPLVIDSNPDHVLTTFNTIIGRLQTGPLSLPGPVSTGIAISPTGSWIYVLSQDNQIVQKVGAVGWSVEGQITLGPVGPNLERIALTADGALAFVTNNSQDTVYVIQTSDMTLAHDPPIPVAAGPFGVAAR